MEKLLTVQGISEKSGFYIRTIRKYAQILYPDREVIPFIGRLYKKNEADRIIHEIVKAKNDHKEKYKNEIKYKDDKIAIISISNCDVIIDIENLDEVIKHYWKKNGKRGRYFVHKTKKNGKYISILLHRYIMKVEKGQFLDHINMNTLDNRKCNLRLCTLGQNNMNRGMIRSNKSGYKGVVWEKDRRKWKAAVSINNKSKRIGSFNTAEEAYEAYCNAIKELHGEFVRLA